MTAALFPCEPETVSSYIQPVDYPTGQKIALLEMHRGALAADLVTRLRAMSCEPTPADVQTMIEHGRITGLEGQRRLTPMGLHAAQAISRDLAAKLGIHAISYAKAQGNYGPSAQCTCGFNVHSHRGRSGDANVSGIVSHHLRQVRAGTLPPAYRHTQPRIDSQGTEDASRSNAQN